MSKNHNFVQDTIVVATTIAAIPYIPAATLIVAGSYAIEYVGNKMAEGSERRKERKAARKAAKQNKNDIIDVEAANSNVEATVVNEPAAAPA